MKRRLGILVRVAGIGCAVVWGGACGGPQDPGPVVGVSTSPPPSSTALPPITANVEHATKILVPPAIHVVVDANDRAEKDRELDAGRHPGELLAFAGIAPGMHVAELGVGVGYTTELLARAVGPTGAVFAQNNKFILERFADKPLSLRLAKPVNKNVVSVEREFDDPLPPEATNLDAVLIVLLYHDTVWQEVDRGKMNRAVFAALKPGGEYIVVDHAAREGSGLGDVKTLHRIEEKTVVDEVQHAGFRLAADADFLRNASDPHDWNASPTAAASRRGQSDRFVLKFVKPQ